MATIEGNIYLSSRRKKQHTILTLRHYYKKPIIKVVVYAICGANQLFLGCRLGESDL